MCTLKLRKMGVSAEQILNRLPPYVDEWELLVEEQYVSDIIKEVGEAHKLFAWYYDQFSDLFYNRNAKIVADNLFTFCSDYIRYKEETVQVQTSAIPAGILYRGFGDCKHYALFSAGVISSLNRLYNCCFDASFYFVSYRKGKEPYHVYVCLRDSETDCDIWIDPTPGSGGTPITVVRKRV